MATVSVDIAQQLDITCRQGDTFILDLTITTTAGAAQDMTGYGGALIVKAAGSDTPILEFFTPTITSPVNRTIDDTYNAATDGLITMAFGGGSNNVVRFTAAASLMDAIPSGTYNYDFAVQYGTLSENFITTYTKGTFTVNEDV